MAREWERFLTDQDKEHLKASGWGEREPYGLGARPAVIVVDDYYGALGTERKPLLESVKEWPMSCGLEGWEAIDRTVDLLAAARRLGFPIIYLRSLPKFPSRWAPQRRGQPAPADSAHLRNEIVAEIAPLSGDLVIEKAAPSGFQGTPLNFHLNHFGVDSLVICGESTSGCVRATVVDSATHRYKVTVVEDCCFDRTQASHWISLFDMSQKYADVMSLSELLPRFKEWQG